jgi:hypothetical protein
MDKKSDATNKAATLASRAAARARRAAAKKRSGKGDEDPFISRFLYDDVEEPPKRNSLSQNSGNDCAASPELAVNIAKLAEDRGEARNTSSGLEDGIESSGRQGSSDLRQNDIEVEI